MIRAPSIQRGQAKRQKTTTTKSRIPVSVRIGKQPFPKQLTNTVRYVDWLTFSFTSGLGTYVFSANGLYDPNTTGTGHQPLYFDQLAAVYNHYTVLKSRIKVTFNTIIPFMLSIKCDDDATPPSATYVALETPNTKGGLYYAPGTGLPVLRESYDAEKVFGKGVMAQEDLQGSSGANPLDGQFYQIQVYEPQLTTGSMQLLVEIDYDVVWSEMTTTGPS